MALKCGFEHPQVTVRYIVGNYPLQLGRLFYIRGNDIDSETILR